MRDYSVNANVQKDYSQGLTQPHAIPKPRARTLGLWFEEVPSRQEGNFLLSVQPGEANFFPNTFDRWRAYVPLTKGTLWGLVKECRNEWHNVIYRKEEGAYVYQDEWDFADTVAFCTGDLRKLALAGSDLFNAIFFSSREKTTAANLANLRTIGRALRNKMLQGNYWIRVISDSFHVPWNLLYSGELNQPEGDNVRKEGFWGYQHIVEHAAEKAPDYAGIFNPYEPLNVALQLDENIDTTFDVACNSVVMNKLTEYREDALKLLPPRNKRDALARALNTKPLDDHILYFCCHGHAELDACYLTLTDKNNHIKPSQIDRWMDDNEFTNGPLVFLNACQSAQMNSVFYDGFVNKFLAHRASTVIGAATAVPAIFAGEFARRFFDRFFEGGVDENEEPLWRAGDVMFDLRRQFLDYHKNPLGLLYSIYHGADAFLERPIPKKLSR